MTSEIIAALNELLEAERAGVETLGKLRVAYGEIKADLERIEKDEGWSCVGLHKYITQLGGPASQGKGDFAAKVMALPTLSERLQLLARGQQWVIRKTDALLEKGLDGRTAAFLQEMKEVHRRNVEWCQLQVQALQPSQTPT